MPNPSKRKYQVFQPMILAAMLALGMYFGYKMAENSGSAKLFGLTKNAGNSTSGTNEELIRLLQEKYLFKPDLNRLEEDILIRIFSKLDPYSVYISPGELASVNSYMQGNFQGLGIEMLNVKDTVVIMDILPESPAAKIGLNKMDRLLSLNGKSLVGKELSMLQIRSQVLNAQNKKMELIIFRKSSGKKLKFIFTPENVESPSISQYALLNDSTLYMKIDQFHAKTYREFMLLVEKYKKDDHIPGLILDLRDNPGGYLTEVTKILSEFFEESDLLLVSTAVKDGRVKEYKTTGRSFFKFGKIIVLINKNSASGSEVLAGVVQDWDIGWVIGEKSYGKGLVQEQFKLSNGGAARLTVANYYLPTGRSIQHALEMDKSLFMPLKEKYSALDSFVTLKMKRKLPVSEGVMPDQIVSDELSMYSDWTDSAGPLLFDHEILHYIENHPILYNMDANVFFENYKFEDQTLTHFKQFTPKTKGYNNSQLSVLIKYRMGQLLFGKLESFRFIKDKDIVLQAAVRKMTEEEWFKKN